MQTISYSCEEFLIHEMILIVSFTTRAAGFLLPVMMIEVGRFDYLAMMKHGCN